MNMFTIFDKCYHRPRTCDMLQELRDIQTKLQELKKKEIPDLPKGYPGIRANEFFTEWLEETMRGVRCIDTLPRYSYDYTREENKDVNVCFTEYLYSFADYIKEIADCRQNWDDYKKEKDELMQRETELKKQLGIK